MQTLYDETSNFIRHTGNLVDLEEFRQKVFAARRTEPVWQPVREPEQPAFRPVVLSMSEGERRRAQALRRTWTLDACASLAVVIMTVVFTLRVLL